ncbi:APC family permease [Rhodococcus opacus]|nr:APC family permease [Rhodococcus opacus]
MKRSILDLERVSDDRSNQHSPSISEPEVSGDLRTLFHLPFGIFSLFGFSILDSNGYLATAYIVATVAVILTAISYGKMAREFPSTGSSYSYARHSIGPSAGFLTGWTTLLDYFLLPLLCVSLAANYVKGEILPEVPMALIVLVFAVLITVVNALGVKVTTSFSALLFIFQIVIVAIFIVLCAILVVRSEGPSGLVSSRPFWGEDFEVSSIVIAAALICNTFLGFDAVTTMSEETVDPRHNIPRALVLVGMAAGTLFTVVAYFAFVANPVVAYDNPATAPVDVSRIIGGALFGSVFLAGCVISSLASAVVTQASASRLLYAMGRDNVLPKRIFGGLNRRRVPIIPIVILGVVSVLAAVIQIDAIASVVNFGAFTAFSVVHVSVFMHYFVRGRRRTPRDVFSFVVMPLLGLLVVVGLWTQLSVDANVLGLSWVGWGLSTCSS